MRFRNLNKWNLEDNIVGLLFFAQRIDELLFDYTLDSYKPAALNAPFLCTEAISLSYNVEIGLIEKQNLDHVIDELVWSIKNDKIAKALLDVPLEKYIQLDEENIQKQRLRLEVLSKTLDPNRYLIKCCELLKEAIVACQKKKIDNFSKLFITTLINMGMSKSYLYKKSKSFFFLDDNEINDVNALDAYFEYIAPIEHNFDVYIYVSHEILTVKNSLKKLSVEILDEFPEKIQAHANLISYQKGEDDVCVHIQNIRGYDEYSARNLGESRLDILKDLFTLFFHKNNLKWKDLAIVSRCCIDTLYCVGITNKAMYKAYDMSPERAAKSLNWMMSNLALRYTDSFYKFNRIADLHGMCVASDVPENQLLNIWISIETIVPNNKRKSKIENIIANIDPFLRLTYINRIIDTVVADLFKWDARVAFKVIRKVKNCPSRKTQIRFLYLLLLESNADLLSSLYESLRDFHLLRFRIFSIKELLKNPISVKEMLDQHSRKTSWQLRRIYRHRNLLVHQGSAPKYLSTLIENGHDYLDIVINSIMVLSCNDYKVETLEQAFELQCILLERFNAFLNSANEFNDENIICLYN